MRSFGKSGQEISNHLPHIGSIADDICIIRSMQTEQINHDPAHTFMNTGTSISGRPSMGSWVNYGLGSESRRPARLRRADEPRRHALAAADFVAAVAQRLPARASSRACRSTRRAIRCTTSAIRRASIARGSRTSSTTINRLNRMQRRRRVHNPEIATRIAQYELAFRMQMSVPELVDIADEPQHVLDMYGVNGAGRLVRLQLPARPPAGRARRAVHSALSPRLGLPRQHRQVHAASCAQSADQAERRADHRSQAARHARRHARRLGRRVRPHADGPGRRQRRRRPAATITSAASRCGWPAAASSRGISHGATDELGYYAVENIVHVHDLHATMLHLLGIDHERLTYRYQGRDFRLTDVAGKVVNGIVA